MEEIEEDNFIQVDEKTIILQSSPSQMPRLTPTGKISYAKTRVYTQRYRKEWEQMSDFRGWLTSVPLEPTRAFCKYCKKDLHAHRLSLLKHMCTMKHQRSALMYQNDLATKNKNTKNRVSEITEVEYSEGEENRDGLEETEEGVEYSIEELETGEEIHFPEHKYARDFSDEEGSFKGHIKTIKLEMADLKRDKLAEAMAHVHGEVSEENAEHIQMDMDVVSETVETSEFEEISEPLSEAQHLSFVTLNSSEPTSQINEDETFNSEEETEHIEFVDTNLLKATTLKKLTVPMGNTITLKPNHNKTILLSSGAKGVTLTPRKNTPGAQYVMSKFKTKPNEEKKASLVLVSPKLQESQSSQQEASTSQAKKIMTSKSPTAAVKKPTISTHVLDMTKGLPIGGLQVSLYKLLDGRWTFVNECNTSAAGRCIDLMSDKNPLTTGRYKLHFDVDKYFTLRKVESLYPFIEIVFDVKNPVISYHIPVLLSPFGYTTYRGMDR